MERQRIEKLIAGGETKNVDFKLKCLAIGGTEGEKGELAKDICAMANNSPAVSYIIIGVTDGGRGRKGVVAPKLTDDNVQTFVRDAVSPPPRVRLDDVQTTGTGGRKVLLKVLVVGKNPRHAYRLARDYIDYPAKRVFRRNEVWIRRGATSDLATPEEVARLVKGLDPEDCDGKGQVYARIWPSGLESVVFDDLAAASKELQVHVSEKVAVLSVCDEPFVLRVFVCDEFAPHLAGCLPVLALRHWAFEHGVLIVTSSRLSSKFNKTTPGDTGYYRNVRETWGEFFLYTLDGFGSKSKAIDTFPMEEIRLRTLRNGKNPFSLPIFVFDKTKDSASFKTRIRGFVSFCHDGNVDQDLWYEHDVLNDALRRVVRSRRAVVPKCEGRIRRDGLAGYTISDEKLHCSSAYVCAAQFTLALAKGKVPSPDVPRMLGENLEQKIRPLGYRGHSKGRGVF